MQLIEIRSAHDLTAKMPAQRRPGPHEYKLHCNQFAAMQKQWRKTEQRTPTLGLMTLGMDQIWITDDEVKAVEDAIQNMQRSVAID